MDSASRDDDPDDDDDLGNGYILGHLLLQLPRFDDIDSAIGPVWDICGQVPVRRPFLCPVLKLAPSVHANKMCRPVFLCKTVLCQSLQQYLKYYMCTASFRFDYIQEERLTSLGNTFLQL